MSRFFFAVAPPEPLISRLEAFRGRWGHPHHRVEPHITVKVPFVWPGEPAAFLEPVRMACRGSEPLTVRLGGPAQFPDAPVLYLTAGGAGLRPLHEAVLGALAGLVPADPRSHEGDGYTPHLTLAVGRFGIDDAGLDAMEREAAAELGALSEFAVTALRCYRREGADDRWEPFSDLSLGR